jgi:hypothetical protein
VESNFTSASVDQPVSPLSPLLLLCSALLSLRFMNLILNTGTRYH